MWIKFDIFFLYYRWSGGGNSTLASLPMIGLDDALGAPAAAPAPPAPAAPAPPPPAPHAAHNGYARPYERPAPPAPAPAPPERPHHNTYQPPVPHQVRQHHHRRQFINSLQNICNSQNGFNSTTHNTVSQTLEKVENLFVAIHWDPIYY